MAERRASMTLSVSADEKAALEALALEYGFQWGDKPNISKLVKAIAHRELTIAKNHDWPSDRIDSLYQAYCLLKDKGSYGEAQVLGELLMERSELSDPLRYEIQSWLNSPGVAWREKIETFRKKQCPFRLVYQDAAGFIWSFTVRYAQITRIETREYLLCWCDETDRNTDVPALQHNWTLRLDRIPVEAELTPIEGEWRGNVDYVEVEMHMVGGLRMAYRSKTEADMVNEWMPGRDIRRVVRRIFNTFWFLREVRRYGADCVVVGPADVRDRLVQDLTTALQHYTEAAEDG